ncbi:MAG: cyclic beta 1-2 glucan synthetase, partial [Acidobacteria bacterium]
PTMLRLALIENLRRVGTTMAAGRIDHDRADYWADQITEIADKDPKSLIITVAEMTRSSPKLSSSFVAELDRRLQGQGSGLALALTWIEQRLSEGGLTIKKLVQSENQQQAADQVSISNSIGSLRLLGLTDWRDFVESTSAVETVLRGDPGRTYGKMDFATRDRYRHVIERISRRADIPEQMVAGKAIELAREAFAQEETNRSAHVGFYLVDKGVPLLERKSGIRQSAGQAFRRAFGRFPLVPYAGTIGLITTLLSASLLCSTYSAGTSGGMLVLLGIVSLLSFSYLATAIVNCLAILLAAADALPRMDFSEGIPAGSRTLVVIPTMLTSAKNVEDLAEALEVRFLANRDSNLHFALLTDFRDAIRESLPEDEALLRLATARIEALNERYAEEKSDTFFLLHRPRRWNPQERTWMGYERKRGKLADLNAMLRSGPNAKEADRFALVVGRTGILSGVKYVITLDTDTQLPRGAARQMVGALSHPLNRAQYDTTLQRVSEGYGILQPRVAVSLPGTNRSRYARMFGNEPGIDPKASTTWTPSNGRSRIVCLTI